MVGNGIYMIWMAFAILYLRQLDLSYLMNCIHVFSSSYHAYSILHKADKSHDSDVLWFSFIEWNLATYNLGIYYSRSDSTWSRRNILSRNF
jgi:hypothetical protein